MKLFFWYGLDVGGEYADAWIGVIAKTQERAAEIVRDAERDWGYKFSGYCENQKPDEVLALRASEKERLWAHGS